MYLGACSIPKLFFLKRTDAQFVTQAIVVPAWGANVVALSVQAPSWSWPVPVLEAVDFATLATKPTSFGMPLLAPTPGRVGQDQTGICYYGGQEYRLRPSRHGFLRDVPWLVTDGAADRLTCTVQIDSEDQEWGFPFRFRAEHQITLLDGALHSRVRIKNTGCRVQPLNVGWHPYLHRDGECTVRIPAARRWELDGREEPTPTGRLTMVGAEDDFRRGRTLPQDETWDDVFTDLSSEDGEILCWVEQPTRVQTANGTETGLRLRRYVRLQNPTTEAGTAAVAHVQLYTPLGRNALTIEPLSAPPNALNLLASGHPHADVCELDPGRSVSFEIVVGLTVAPA